MDKHTTLYDAAADLADYMKGFGVSIGNSNFLDIHNKLAELYNEAFKHGKVQAYKDVLNKVKTSKDETTKEC